MSLDELQRPEGREDHVEARVGERQVGGGAEHRGHGHPGLLVDAPRVLQLPEGQVEPVAAAALGADPARALSRAGADLEHVAVGDVAEDAGLGLGQALGPPHEADVAEEVAVRGLVLVGVAVPVGTVGPAGTRPRRPGGARRGRAGGRMTARRSRSATTAMDLTSLTPLAGGWSGETFVADVAGERSVVRIYARPSHRGAAAHEVDAALLRLVRGLVPVPEVLEVRRADPASRPAGAAGDLVPPGGARRPPAASAGRPSPRGAGGAPG